MNLEYLILYIIGPVNTGKIRLGFYPIARAAPSALKKFKSSV